MYLAEDIKYTALPCIFDFLKFFKQKKKHKKMLIQHLKHAFISKMHKFFRNNRIYLYLKELSSYHNL